MTLPSALIDRSLKMNVWLEKNIPIAGKLLSVWDFNDLCLFLLLSPPAAGTMGGLFLDGEESPALEDISKWTVEDVCSFVSSLAGCTEYTQVNLLTAPRTSREERSPRRPVFSLPSVPVLLHCPSQQLCLRALQGMKILFIYIFFFCSYALLNSYLLPVKTPRWCVQGFADGDQ